MERFDFENAKPGVDRAKDVIYGHPERPLSVSEILRLSRLDIMKENPFAEALAEEGSKKGLEIATKLFFSAGGIPFIG